MRFRRIFGRAVVALTVLSVCSLHSAVLAQGFSTHPWLSAGLDLRLYDGPTLNLGFLAMAGVEFRRPDLPFSGRLGAAYFRRTRDVDESALVCDGCRQQYRFDMPGVMVEGMYSLGAGAVRPYLSTGLGVYRATTTRKFNYDCPATEPGAAAEPCVIGGTDAHIGRTRDYSVGLQAGLGLSFPTGGSRMYAELRYCSFTSGTTQEGWILPLVVGFEF